VGVQANWHSPVVEIDDGDPFENVPARVEDVGIPIVLDGGDRKAQLSQTLIHAMEAEAMFDAQGIRCAIKGHAETTCHACPLSKRVDSRHQALCRLGKRQEEVLTELVVIAHREERAEGDG
jgi:hypothetical protein